MKKTLGILAFVLVPFVANAQSTQYAPSCPDDNHPHVIDLGLPSGTKWACCNIGASKPEESGGFYAWGETVEKEDFSWDTYIHCDGSYDTCQDLASTASMATATIGLPHKARHSLTMPICSTSVLKTHYWMNSTAIMAT